LGVETLGGVMTALIERNTTIPVRKAETFSTAEDGQTAVDIHVLQGERPMAADNKSLGKFILDGIPPAPRGIPQVEVTFDIDANGILKVTASDKATGRSQHITITASSGLNDTEVERMRKDAEAHAADDTKRKELIEARNAGDNAVYTSEKALRDLGDKVPADVRSKVEAAAAKVREALPIDDAAKIKAATDELYQVIQQIGASVYQPEGPAAGAAGPQPDGPTSGPQGESGDDDVVDGEFRSE